MPINTITVEGGENYVTVTNRSTMTIAETRTLVKEIEQSHTDGEKELLRKLRQALKDAGG